MSHHSSQFGHRILIALLNEAPVSSYGGQYRSGFLRGLELVYRSCLRGQFRSYNRRFRSYGSSMVADLDRSCFQHGQ
jgi:hypothetical protein